MACTLMLNAIELCVFHTYAFRFTPLCKLLNTVCVRMFPRQGGLIHGCVVRALKEMSVCMSA